MWRTLTEADILGVLNASETAAYKVAAKSRTQDVLADAIRGVVNQCRGYIADHAANRLAEGVTLPERTHLSALHIIRVEIITRLDMEVSKDRADAKRDAIRFFERVSEGLVGIEQPTGAVDDTGSAPMMKTGSSRERMATREKLSGL